MGKLVRLELSNFKSYKGHHVLQFGDSYFTSIIGPNGSGKSNSMDAISFVLGIKSLHLRSTNLKDLIYRGRVLNNDNTGGNTQTNPQEPHSSQSSDPQTAWVMAVYLDDAHNEQLWKRTITVSGQSEYRINDRIVSAKQYNETLEAENILISARNFLVFQGDVEAIANKNPKDLTRLIEQISGSLEFKAEYDRLKGEMEQTAEEQAYMLQQRRGINQEVRQYQDQKREAEKFNRKSKERDSVIVNHAVWKLYHFQCAIDTAQQELSEKHANVNQLSHDLQGLEWNLEKARRAQAEITREISKVDKRISSCSKEISAKESSLIPIKEKMMIAGRNVKKFQDRVTEITKERDSRLQIIEKLHNDLSTVRKAQSKWEAQWQASRRQRGLELTEADLHEYNRLRGEVTKQTSAAQSQLSIVKRQLKTQEEALRSINSDVEAFQSRNAKLEIEINELVARRDSLKEKGKGIQEDISVKKMEINSLTSDRLRTAQVQSELDEKLQTVLNKLVEADTGRRESEKEIKAKEIMSALKRIFPGVRGKVHELCRPKQKRYETAVATVLGRNMDAIVVNTEKTAKECILFLREQRAGQGTFIPLDSISVKPINPVLKGMHEGMRLAIDTIDFDHSVERAIMYACGNTMVCNDLSIAKHLCFDKKVEAKAVTLDGTVIHKGGLMTGGRGKQDSGHVKRWENSELENLKKLRDKLLKEIAALKTTRKSGEEAQVQLELNGLEQQSDWYESEIKALEMNISGKQSVLENVKNEVHKAEQGQTNLESTIARLKGEMSKNENLVWSVEDVVFREFCVKLGYKDIREYDNEQGIVNEEAGVNKLNFTTQITRLENQISFEQSRLTSAEGRLESLKGQTERDSTMIHSLDIESREINEICEKMKAERDTFEREMDSLNAVHEQRREEVARESESVEKQKKTLEVIRAKIESLEAEQRKNVVGRYNLLRKCKIEGIRIPLLKGSKSLEALPLDVMVRGSGDDGSGGGDAMDIDGGEGVQTANSGTGDDTTGVMEDMDVGENYGISIDFSGITREMKEDSSSDMDKKLQEKISEITTEMEKLAPNMRATNRLNEVENRLKGTEKEFEAARLRAKRAKEAFMEVKNERLKLFNKAFDHISEQIGTVYKELTRSSAFPLGGQAYLDTEDADEAYLGGLKYHAMPPLKRFRDMEHLSGGEKSMAALALIFSIHSYKASPFFVLDEVDAALDHVNVCKIAKYIRDNRRPGMQFIVISLKTALFQQSDTLIGIMRDQAVNSSKALTLDLRQYSS